MFIGVLELAIVFFPQAPAPPSAQKAAAAPASSPVAVPAKPAPDSLGAALGAANTAHASTTPSVSQTTTAQQPQPAVAASAPPAAPMKINFPTEDPDASFHQFMAEEDGEDDINSPEYQEAANRKGNCVQTSVCKRHKRPCTLACSFFLETDTSVFFGTSGNGAGGGCTFDAFVYKL